MFKQLSQTIEELDGVFSCKITGKNSIDEIHIIASKAREPKKIVRDIETIVLVNLDEKIDHKKISIAQVKFANEEDNKNRVELISIYCENNRPVCHLQININDEKIIETFTSNPGETNEKLIARSVVETISHYTHFKKQIIVDDVFTIEGKDRLVLVKLNIYNQNENRIEKKLVGAVYFDNVLPSSIGKACLKALNRQLHNYI